MGTDIAIVVLAILILFGSSRDRKFDKRTTEIQNRIDKIERSNKGAV